MPYITKEKRPLLDKNPFKHATDPGDLTYVFSRFFYARWQESPRWTTYHKLRTLVREPNRDPEFFSLYQGFASLTRFTLVDVQEAAEEAREEFFWRVVRKYEDGKKVANGDVFKQEVGIQ